MTKIFTHKSVDIQRPNCEINWPTHFGGASIPFDKIWPTLGTPLSDATEERNWRKMLHRAIFVRNRVTANQGTPACECRLGCGQEESMLHLVQCRNARVYWSMVKSFLEKVLSINNTRRIDKLLIFNTIRNELGPTEACAFIRHTFNHFYRDFAMVDTHGKKLVWQSTLNRAMKGFSGASATPS